MKNPLILELSSNLAQFFKFFFCSDDLIFVVPKFARRWNTIGGLREEKIEAFHNIGKKVNCTNLQYK